MAFGDPLDKRVILDAAAHLQTKLGPRPELFVIQVSNGAAGTVSGEAGNTAVGVYNFAAIVGLFAVKLFENCDPVRASACMPVTDRPGKIRHRINFGKR